MRASLNGDVTMETNDKRQTTNDNKVKTELVNKSTKNCWLSQLRTQHLLPLKNHNLLPRARNWQPKTAGCKIISTPKTMKPKIELSTFNEKTRDVDSSDENTTVVKFKEENPVLEETIQSLLVRSGQGWSCSICGKSNRRLAKISRHAETHVDGFSHLCPHCENMCKTRNGLEHHIKSKHEEGSSLFPKN